MNHLSPNRGGDGPAPWKPWGPRRLRSGQAMQEAILLKLGRSRVFVLVAVLFFYRIGAFERVRSHYSTGRIGNLIPNSRRQNTP